MARKDGQDPADAIKDSAQQIWLAGLGAFARAQQEGAKVFEALVKEGASAQKKTQAAAEEGLAQAQSRLAGMASDLSSRAAGQWGKLESLFEDRVARALERLGMPSAADVAALQARVEALETELRRRDAAAAARRVTPAKRARRTAAAASVPVSPAPRKRRAMDPGAT